MERRVILLISLGIGLCITRVAVYGVDFGLLSVVLSDLPMNWGRALLDFGAGYAVGAGIGMLRASYKAKRWHREVQAPGKMLPKQLFGDE